MDKANKALKQVVILRIKLTIIIGFQSDKRAADLHEVSHACNIYGKLRCLCDCLQLPDRLQLEFLARKVDGV